MWDGAGTRSCVRLTRFLDDLAILVEADPDAALSAVFKEGFLLGRLYSRSFQ
eukprot:CAMPEP_0184419536 /NCGR_PEP_ID=MMETSP0738-20130409/39871_1 /TAXON_ID=385413 /ORGANISM="Thalassiosira miniscula, Strain CCMP1093" /LENGTH=51 /DNA_ID=CAMNT_0026780061 /DNA_START=44 /DNA_END=199 /DNA_ORIENTATION=-